MTGVQLEDLKQIETIFNLHIDVFGLKEIETADKRKKKGTTQKNCAVVV